MCNLTKMKKNVDKRSAEDLSWRKDLEKFLGLKIFLLIKDLFG